MEQPSWLPPPHLHSSSPTCWLHNSILHSFLSHWMDSLDGSLRASSPKTTVRMWFGFPWCAGEPRFVLSVIPQDCPCLGIAQSSLVTHLGMKAKHFSFCNVKPSICKVSVSQTVEMSSFRGGNLAELLWILTTKKRGGGVGGGRNYRRISCCYFCQQQTRCFCCRIFASCPDVPCNFWKGYRNFFYHICPGNIWAQDDSVIFLGWGN